MIADDAERASAHEHYERERYVVLPGLIGPETLDHLVAYAHILRETGAFRPDRSVGRSLSAYGAPGFDALLLSLGGSLSEVAGVVLTPTYSYARWYFEGDVLLRHRDRAACEHSISLHLASSGGSWPIEIERIDGDTARLDLAPGDGVMYRGIEMPHWRVECPAEWYLQVFLHWVDQHGAHHDQALDGRATLGGPAVPRARE